MAPVGTACRTGAAGIHTILGTIAAFITSTISTLGYGGVIGLMAIESACIPLPSEIILPFSGYLVATGRFDLFLVATAGAIGCNLGSTVAYAVGFYGGRPAVERWGRYVLLNRHELARVERYFDRWGSITVLISRMLPVVRTFIALPAGIARMPMLRFQLYTFIGSWPWCFVLAYVGMKLGQAWDTSPTLQAVFHDLHLVIFALLLLAVAFYAAWQWRRRPAAQKTPDITDLS